MNTNSVSRERTPRRQSRRTNAAKPYYTRSRSPLLPESVADIPIKRCKHTLSSREIKVTAPLPPVLDLDRFILPQTELFANNRTNNSLNSVKPEHRVLTDKDRLFDSLAATDITNKSGYKQIQVDWTERHLQVTPGVNLLVMCKNDLCEFYLNNVICPRGLYPDRNGYCPMDREMFMIKCPICKLPISPDASVGIGFYRCEFQISYMMRSAKSRSVELSATGDTLVYAKFGKANNEKFLYLDVNVGAMRSLD